MAPLRVVLAVRAAANGRRDILAAQADIGEIAIGEAVQLALGAAQGAPSLESLAQAFMTGSSGHRGLAGEKEAHRACSGWWGWKYCST